jgi:GNAT superfamily N-acetyltransferase
VNPALLKGVRYVYRLEPEPNGSTTRNGYTGREGVAFVRLRRPPDAVRHFSLLRFAYGWSGALKALLKLGTGRRVLFGFVRENRLVSHVWATEHSPRYPIGAHACVLGPLETGPEMRRQGLATALLQAAASSLAEQGYRAVYIDTTPSNRASRTAIARAGFAPYAIVNGGRVTELNRGDTFPALEIR